MEGTAHAATNTKIEQMGSTVKMKGFWEVILD